MVAAGGRRALCCFWVHQISQRSWDAWICWLNTKCVCHFQQFPKLRPVCHSQLCSRNVCRSHCWYLKPLTPIIKAHKTKQQTRRCFYIQKRSTDIKLHSPVPVFIFVCVGEELRASEGEVQSSQGQVSVAKANQLDRRSQALVLILHWLRDDLQVWQTCLLHFPDYMQTPQAEKEREMK